MDPVERELFSDVVGIPNDSVKEMEMVFGDDIGLDQSSDSEYSGGETSSSSSCDLRAPIVEDIKANNISDIHVEKILGDPEKAKKTQHKRESSTRMSMIAQIERYLNFLKSKKIEIPPNIQKLTRKIHKRSGEEIREARNQVVAFYNDSETSESITEIQMTVIGLICAFFNGKNAVPFTKFKLNLTGYNQQLRRKMKDIVDQNLKIASKVNQLLSSDIIMVVKMFSLYASPLFVVILANHGPSSGSDIENFDALDEEDETEEEDEDEDETEEEEDSSE